MGTYNPISQLLRAQIGQVNSLDRVQERVIGARLLAPVQVNVPRGRRGGSLIIEQDADYHGQVENLARAKGAPHRELPESTPITTTYTVNNVLGAKRSVAVEDQFDDQLSADAGLMTLEQRAQLKLAIAWELWQEKTVADAMFTAANFTTTYAATAIPNGKGVQYNSAGSDFIFDLVKLIENREDATNGIFAPEDSCVVLGQGLARALQTNDAMRNLVGDLADGPIRQDSSVIPFSAIAEKIRRETGVREVYVGAARLRSSNLGQSLTTSRLWNTESFGLYSLPSPMAGLGNDGMRVEPTCALHLAVPDLDDPLSSRYNEDNKCTEYFTDLYRSVKIIPDSESVATSSLGIVVTNCLA